MITSSPMELISFVVLKDKSEAVASHLLRLGIFHPVDIRHIEEKLKNLPLSQIDRENAQLDALATKTQEIFRKLKLKYEPQGVQNPESFVFSESNEVLEYIEQEIAPLIAKKEELAEELSVNQSLLKQVKEYLPFPIERKSLYSFLDVSTGRIEEKNIPVLERSLKDAPHVIYPFQKEGSSVSTLVIGLRRDRILIEKVLADVAWEEIEYPKESEALSLQAQKKIISQIEQTKKNMNETEVKIENIGQAHRQELSKIYYFIKLKKSLLEARRFSCTTDKTVLFSGWVPDEEKERLISEVKKIADISYVESRSPEQADVPKEDVPVQFKHSPILKPFEMLIDAYGLPRYGSIDPTLFVAISFLIMFGAMFGDIGHGLVLALVSLYLWKSRKENLKKAAALILYCGISSSVFGVLYGSFFGFEFESVWIKPMENILEVFKASIMLGIVLISIGILLNIINALRDKDYGKAIFDKAGLIGGVIYWAAIGLVSRVFFYKTHVPKLYSFLIFGGLLVLFLYPLFEAIFIKRHASIIESFMESIVNLLELFMGYLANTVSFIRVAAFALAHAGLFLAIFSLSEMTKTNGGLGNIAAWVIIILGNILVICLEGLVVSIQSVRLNYYEFFSKFFVSGKQAYKPLAV